MLRHRTVDNGLVLTIARPSAWRDMQLGESISTNGVCLTVSELREDEYDSFVMHETSRLTTFGQAVPKRVNLERAMSVGDRLGGHLVSGHIDSAGKITDLDKSDGIDMTVEFDPVFADLVIRKGSICIDGVSLTVTGVTDSALRVSLIPFTLEQTTLGTLRVGDDVNLEFDMVGKYIANIMEKRQEHASS